jgi:hypothetical protein
MEDRKYGGGEVLKESEVNGGEHGGVGLPRKRGS